MILRKKKRNGGQQQKAFRVFQSRNIVSVKILTKGSALFCKRHYKNIMFYEKVIYADNLKLIWYVNGQHEADFKSASSTNSSIIDMVLI